VRGTVSPLMLNPVPVAVACEMVTAEPPVLVNESVKVRLLPTWALPKARLPGLEVRWPAATMVSVKVAFPVPPLLVALSVTVDVDDVGVPEINPDVLLTDNPAGNPVAP